MASATPAVASETTPTTTTTTTETPPFPVAGNNIFLFLLLLLLLLPAAPFFDRLHTMSLLALVIFAAGPGSCAGSAVFIVAGTRRFWSFLFILCREGSGFSCRGCRVQEHSMYACISLSLSLFLVLPPLSFFLGHSSFESYKHQETVKNITMYFRSKISKSVGTSSTSLQGFLNVEKNCWGRRDESVESSVLAPSSCPEARAVVVITWLKTRACLLCDFLASDLQFFFSRQIYSSSLLLQLAVYRLSTVSSKNVWRFL